MANSTFERSLLVTAPAHVCWDLLTDITRLAGWVGVLEDVTEVEEMASYRATLSDRIGPFKLRADLAVTVLEVKPGSELVLVAEGEDNQVSSRILVNAGLHLMPEGAGTLLRVVGSYEVTGRVASSGASMINRKAEKILDDFFEMAAADLGGG